MGATAIIALASRYRATMMKMMMITMLAFAALATALPSADEVVPEMEIMQATATMSAHAEAKATVESMIKAGKDEGACADLAAATIKEVEDAVDGHQKILDSLDTGSDCAQEGQEEVDSGKDSLEQANKDKVAIDAANADVNFAPVAYNSLTPG